VDDRAPVLVSNTFQGYATILPQNPLILEKKIELAQTALNYGRKDPENEA